MSKEFQNRPHLSQFFIGLQVPGIFSVSLQSRLPTVHARATLCFMNGPAVLWGLCHVPEGCGQVGGGAVELTFRSPRQSECKWVKPRSTNSICPKGSRAGRGRKKQKFPFWVRLCFKENVKHLNNIFLFGLIHTGVVRRTAR